VLNIAEEIEFVTEKYAGNEEVVYRHAVTIVIKQKIHGLVRGFFNLRNQASKVYLKRF
jgi:hypothetical protein